MALLMSLGLFLANFPMLGGELVETRVSRMP
jgi:hypothetical protein